MGQSPSADLFYGYDLGDLTDPDTYDSLRPAWMGDEDEDGEEREEVDPEEYLAARLGWVEVPFPDSLADPDYSLPHEERRRLEDEQRATPEYQEWSANHSQMRALVEAQGVELDYYGYLDGDETCYCVRVKASAQRAHDWGSTELTPLVVDPAWDGQLAEFMRLMELPVPAGKAPGWHMNCSYG